MYGVPLLRSGKVDHRTTNDHGGLGTTFGTQLQITSPTKQRKYIRRLLLVDILRTVTEEFAG
jgi:hypothetical protein